MIGEHMRKIIIQKKTTEQGPSGAPVETWDNEKTLMAKWFQAKGSESFKGAQKVAVREDRFQFRVSEGPIINNRSAINEGDYRIVMEDRIYDIISINMIGRSHLDLACEVKDNEFYEG